MVTQDEVISATYPTIPHSTTLGDAVVVLLQDGRMQNTTQQVLADALESLTVPRVAVITQEILATEFTDGGGATGTLVMTDSVPAGAILLGSKLTVETGFTGGGQASCTLIIGDGSDTDRYMTGTPSVFATDTNGVETGVPSGSKLIQTANTPTLTITANADITGIIAGAGAMTVSIYYIATV